MNKRYKKLDIIKVSFSIIVILIFSSLFINSEKFHKSNDYVFVNPSFLWIDNSDSDTTIINIDDSNWNIDWNNKWVLQYVVQPWDSLWKIASTFWITVFHLMKINNIKSWKPIIPWQKLVITDEEKWFLYTLKEKTNIVVFANKYNLNLKDLMTLNYISDETEILNKWQELFLNIDLETSYKVWLLERPKVIKLPKLTTVKYKATINKPTVNKTTRRTYLNRTTNSNTTTTTRKKTHSKIIRQRVYKKPIKNRFYAGNCTWWAAILTPEIFPYIDEYHQARPFWWDAKYWYDNARKAWFQVWQIPRIWALVVYKRWYWLWAWHVWKVIAYYPSKRQIIVRDMNWKWKFIFTDRRETIDNKNIRWYVYIPKTPRKPPVKK